MLARDRLAGGGEVEEWSVSGEAARFVVRLRLVLRAFGFGFEGAVGSVAGLAEAARADLLGGIARVQRVWWWW